MTKLGGADVNIVLVLFLSATFLVYTHIRASFRSAAWVDQTAKGKAREEAKAKVAKGKERALLPKAHRST